MGRDKHNAADAASLTIFDFHGDKLDVATTPDGEHWVALDGLCRPFEIQDVWDQGRKLKKCAWATTGIIPVVARDGKIRDVLGISVRSVAGWLFTLNAGKVAPHLREKLVRYQREAADALHDHFFGKRGAVPAGYLSPDQHVAQLEPHVRRVAELEEHRRFLRETNEALLASARSTICADELDDVQRLEHRVVDLWVPLGKAKSRSSALTSVRHRAMPGCFSKGFKMKYIQRELVPKVLRELEVMLADAKEEAKRAGILPTRRRRSARPGADSGQVVLPFEQVRRPTPGKPANTNRHRSA